MQIYFQSSKLKNIFNSDAELQKKYGAEQARKIKIRMSVLKHARTLALVPSEKPDRRHQLVGDRKDTFAVDVVHPYRLIFKPNGKIPRLDDGGIDLINVTEIIIIGIENYHDDK